MLTTLLFDLDGTITHSDPIHYQTWKEMMQGYGLDINPSLYQAKFSGRLNPEIVHDLLPHLSAAEVIELSDRKEATFRDRATDQLQPMPGLPALLQWVEQQGLQRAAVTNAPRANAEFMLRVLGLTEVFPIVVLGEELPAAKPDPLPYQVAMERLHADPAVTLAFEDSPSGVRSAVGAGIPTIAIASTHDPDHLYQLGAKLVISDFTDDRLWNFLRLQVA